MAEQYQENNKPAKWMIQNLMNKKLACYDEANNKVPRMLVQEG